MTAWIGWASEGAKGVPGQAGHGWRIGIPVTSWQSYVNDRVAPPPG